MSYISFCNFNSKSDGRRYDFFFHFRISCEDSARRLLRVFFDPQRSFGNPLRTFRQYLASPVLAKSRFFLLRRNFPPQYAGTSRMLPRVLAVWAKTLRGAIKVKRYFGEKRFNFPRTIIKVKPEFGGRIHILGSVR